MKQKTFLFALAMALSICTAQAQGLGGLLKKVNKGLEKVTGVTNGDAATSTASTIAVQPVKWGGTMVNPASKLMDVQLLGIYGVKKTENLGEVYVVLIVKSKIAKEKLIITGDGTVAFDALGNKYQTYFHNVGATFAIAEGVEVRCDLSQSEGRSFLNVPIGTVAFKKMKIYYNFNDYTLTNGKGFIEFNDVPIKWNVETE